MRLLFCSQCHFFETGYQDDLESIKGGYFREMADSQGAAQPERDINQELAEEQKRVQEILDETEEDTPEVIAPPTQSIYLGNWMFDVVADLASHNSAPQAIVPPRVSRIIENEALDTPPARGVPRASKSPH